MRTCRTIAVLLLAALLATGTAACVRQTAGSPSAQPLSDFRPGSDAPPLDIVRAAIATSSNTDTVTLQQRFDDTGAWAGGECDVQSDRVAGRAYLRVMIDGIQQEVVRTPEFQLMRSEELLARIRRSHPDAPDGSWMRFPTDHADGNPYFDVLADDPLATIVGGPDAIVAASEEAQGPIDGIHTWRYALTIDPAVWADLTLALFPDDPAGPEERQQLEQGAPTDVELWIDADGLIRSLVATANDPAGASPYLVDFGYDEPITVPDPPQDQIFDAEPE